MKDTASHKISLFCGDHINETQKKMIKDETAPRSTRASISLTNAMVNKSGKDVRKQKHLLIKREARF